MEHLTDDEFDSVVQDAIDSLPEEFKEDLDNVVFMTQDEPNEDQMSVGQDPEMPGGTHEQGELLGLYDGVDIQHRGFYELDAPDVITIFKYPHERVFHTRDEIEKQIRKTVIHEVGHYFGLDDERLHEMGY